MTPGWIDRSAYPFDSHYLHLPMGRMHYVDEGSGPPVVLVHGNPTWSFLYRHQIARLSSGFRCVAADHLGFGLSDKPGDWSYRPEEHARNLAALIEELQLSDITLVVQDWGGPIGLRIAVDEGPVLSRLCILNTWLFDGTGRMSEGFAAWRAFVERTPDLPIGRIMRNAAVRPWPDEVIAGYEAPFPSTESKTGAARFPRIVPLRKSDPGAAEMARVRSALGSWPGPAQVLFSTADPIFPTALGERWVRLLPTAEELETVENAGHFLQEDAGEEVAGAIVAFLRATD
jgi:haloalkane dehalogenase